jgi:hypothetical protein
LHDCCWARCGADKSQCDEEFRHRMVNTCDYKYSGKKNPKKLEQCLSAAGTMFLGVASPPGFTAFVDMQTQFCGCCDADCIRGGGVPCGGKCLKCESGLINDATCECITNVPTCAGSGDTCSDEMPCCPDNEAVMTCSPVTNTCEVAGTLEIYPRGTDGNRVQFPVEFNIADTTGSWGISIWYGIASFNPFPFEHNGMPPGDYTVSVLGGYRPFPVIEVRSFSLQSGQTTTLEFNFASPCGTDLTECGSICVDTTSDSANCGDCNLPCSDGQTCEEMACVDTQYPPCPKAPVYCIDICDGVPGNVYGCNYMCVAYCPPGGPDAIGCPEGQVIQPVPCDDPLRLCPFLCVDSVPESATPVVT